jgi:hypothetical protein
MTKAQSNFGIRWRRSVLAVILVVGCTDAAIPQTAAPTDEVRFPVAHAHTGSWCMGYLYISADSIRYEVVRPEKDKKHSFQIARSELIAVQQWILLGTPQSATEIKTAHAAYHFWWMPTEDDLQPGQPSHFNPRSAAPPDTLIAALRAPSTVLNGGGTVSQTPGDISGQAAVPGSIPPAGSSLQATSDSQPFSTAPAAGESTAQAVPRGHIGVGVNDAPSSQNKLSGGNGALVRQIEPGGPAAQAGVSVHDVITAMNGAPIRRAADVIAAMAHLAPGSTVDLQILRDGRPLTLTVKVVQSGAPLSSGQPSSTIGAAPPSAGLFSDTNDSATVLLASGNPPLTNQMVSKGIRLFEWLLDAQLTVEQRSQFRNSLVDSWKAHRQDEIEATVNVLNFQDQLSLKSAQERAVIREQLCQKYLDLMRQTPNAVLSRWVLNIYGSAHQPIASGNPPLTAQVADAYAEFVSFMLTESLGRSVLNPDRNFKNALAQNLAAQYSSYSTEQQRQFSQVPLLWELLRLKWSQLSQGERDNYRQRWRPAANSLLSGVAGGSATSGTATSASSSITIPESLGSEHLFVQSMCNSSFATTMNLHLSMWH